MLPSGYLDYKYIYILPKNQSLKEQPYFHHESKWGRTSTWKGIKENECEHIKDQWGNIEKDNIQIYWDKYNWVDEECLFKEPVNIM